MKDNRPSMLEVLEIDNVDVVLSGDGFITLFDGSEGWWRWLECT